MVKKRTFGRSAFTHKIPDLLELQVSSYEWFLQRNVQSDKRNLQGLQAIFNSIFPIKSADDMVVLEFIEFSFGDVRYNEHDAKSIGKTYSAPLRARIRLTYNKTGEIREQEIFFGDLPMMTPRGTFIINGAERVVVSQIHKSPGAFFTLDKIKNLISGRIIPEKGAWLEFELDDKGILGVRIDRRKRILVTQFLRVLGYETNEQIIRLFYKTKEVSISEDRNEELEKELLGQRVIKDIVDKETDSIIIESGDRISLDIIEQLTWTKAGSIEIIDTTEYKDDNTLIRTLAKDETRNMNDALREIFAILRPGEPVVIDKVENRAEKEIRRMFFDEERYDLGQVGRYKINKKFSYEKPFKTKTLTEEDIVETIKYIIRLNIQEVEFDDIDHLGNRRIRSVGELVCNHLRIGFERMERIIRERLTMQDIDILIPKDLFSTKPITASINEFFGTSQLSQFLDQTNPLAELTHKRRLTALGPGGLSRERAGYEVRDVHNTHYGRMCPIETPEGPNIGLIVSMSVFGKINEYGFIETPYRIVNNGKVTNRIEYLTAEDEEEYRIAQASAPVDDSGKFSGEFVAARYKQNFIFVKPDEVDYVDVSPKQIVSLSAALIPFFEHDDANRALMGSNMQRQAVPLLSTEQPLVGTGMEVEAAVNSGVVCCSDVNGEVTYVDANVINIKSSESKEGEVEYKLTKFTRTNQGTCFNQKPIVKVGEKVKKEQIIADGPSVNDGELAIGRNLLVAFVPWEGYNYEDAILISEEIVRDDVFTSIHIEEFEVAARETKLGHEVITKDIPNLGEDAFRNLDEEGIIRVGAEVKPGDILVGKVTPKSETDLTPEYKLLHSIFGEKAREVRDTSLRLPHGNAGIIINVNVFRREDDAELEPGVEVKVKVYVAQKRKLSEGDKLSGRHGNKGVLAKILPQEDMPYLPDGTPVQIVLNPLGVPSRMNIGQILETQAGLAAKLLGSRIITPIFEGCTVEDIENMLVEAGQNKNSKSVLFDGRTGKKFKNDVTIGYIYMMKLTHLVDDKIHARSTGPYSLVTQQPLGGKAQFGGQRLGEMEVWALEAYGAANALQELLTIKSDDMLGRAKVYEAIVKGKNASFSGIPESFNVLVQELRGLCLDMVTYDRKGKPISIYDDRGLDLKRPTSKKLTVDSLFKK